MTSMTQTVSYEEQLLIAKEIIMNHNDFLVVSHINPDGDAASATFAVGLILDQLNKRYVMVNEGYIPPKFQYMSGSERILDYSKSPDHNRKYQFVITVDCADFERVGQVKDWFAEDALILNIDHHPTNNYFGTHQLILTHAAATVEILYDLIETLQLKWNRNLAECIYSGLLTDTGGFRYSNTTSKVMHIASRLIDYGIDTHQLAYVLLEQITKPHILLLKRALTTLSFDTDNKIAWMCVHVDDMEQTKASNEDLDGLVHYPLNIEGVEIGLLFKEKQPNEIKVSLRASGDVNVAAIAQSFGGGGHVKAAGCTIRAEMNEAVEQVLTLVKKALL